MANLRSRQQRLVYLIIYSSADPQKVPSREAFGAIIVNAFEQLCVARVEYWLRVKRNITIMKNVRIPNTLSHGG